MTPKKRRERRAAQRAAEAVKPLPTARPAQRSTIWVAQAQRQLAADLPSVVRNRQAERRAEQPRLVGMDQAPATSQGEAKRSPSRVMQTRAAQPTLDGPNPDLKCRPKSNKPAAGGGSGRRFIPWGKC